jgi:integrase
MILTPEQAYAIVCNLREPERTLTLLAAGTGLRMSECLGLQWHDVNFADGMIHVRRTWTCGQVGLPKSKASKGPVPVHPANSRVSPTCWSKITCGQPLSRQEFFHRTWTITADSWTTRDDSVFTICATASRHFSIRTRTDPKTVQTLLRHSDVKLTLQFYTHAVSRDRMVAAGKMLTAILSHAPDKNGLTADWRDKPHVYNMKYYG